MVCHKPISRHLGQRSKLHGSSEFLACPLFYSFHMLAGGGLWDHLRCENQLIVCRGGGIQGDHRSTVLVRFLVPFLGAVWLLIILLFGWLVVGCVLTGVIITAARKKIYHVYTYNKHQRQWMSEWTSEWVSEWMSECVCVLSGKRKVYIWIWMYSRNVLSDIAIHDLNITTLFIHRFYIWKCWSIQGALH